MSRKRITDRIASEEKITDKLDRIASELEQAYPKLALALDGVSDRLDILTAGAFDSKKINTWASIQDLIVKAMESTNKLILSPDPEGKKQGEKVYNLLSEAQRACKNQMKS